MPKPISVSSADVAGPPSPPNPYDPFPATVDQTPPGVIFRTLWSEADATNRFPAPDKASGDLTITRLEVLDGVVPGHRHERMEQQLALVVGEVLHEHPLDLRGGLRQPSHELVSG